MSLFASYDPTPSCQTPLEFVTRVARRHDIEGLARVAHQREGGDLARLVECFEDFLRTGREHVEVALHEDELIGYGKCGWLTPPLGAPEQCIPTGWYLTGVVVDPRYWRRGVGAALTRARLHWLAGRTDEVFFFASSENRVSIDLHAKHGFEEQSLGSIDFNECASSTTCPLPPRRYCSLQVRQNSISQLSVWTPSNNSNS